MKNLGKSPKVVSSILYICNNPMNNSWTDWCSFLLISYSNIVGIYEKWQCCCCLNATHHSFIIRTQERCDCSEFWNFVTIIVNMNSFFPQTSQSYRLIFLPMKRRLKPRILDPCLRNVKRDQHNVWINNDYLSSNW
jgi:hypothetical protein